MNESARLQAINDLAAARLRNLAPDADPHVLHDLTEIVRLSDPATTDSLVRAPTPKAGTPSCGHTAYRNGENCIEQGCYNAAYQAASPSPETGTAAVATRRPLDKAAEWARMSGVDPRDPGTPPPDSVSLLPSTARALDGYVCPVESVNANLEAMAWLWFVLKETPDTAERFPRGKWATIQRIEQQLIEAAKYTAGGASK